MIFICLLLLYAPILGDTLCSLPHPETRNNPRPLDCMYAITYILSTVPDRSGTVQFSTIPAQGQTKLPYRYSIGTCVVFVVPAQRTSVAPVESSWDEIVRLLLSIVGVCLLNNIPEAWNWGGGARGGTGNGLVIGIQGTQKIGGAADATINETLALAGSESWLEELLPS